MKGMRGSIESNLAHNTSSAVSDAALLQQTRLNKDFLSSSRNAQIIRTISAIEKTTVALMIEDDLDYGKPDNRARAFLRPIGGMSINGRATHFSDARNWIVFCQ